jgi:hypothetical protein
LDSVCKDHDCDYSRAESYDDLIEADRKFLAKTVNATSTYAKLARTLVGQQLQYRLAMAKPKLRGTPSRSKKARAPTYLGQEPGISTLAIGAPAAYSRQISMMKPRFRMNNGRTIIAHSEYVQQVSGSTSLSVSSIPLNPGLSATFTWLASIAASYDKYRWRKLSFHFVPAAATSAKGRITLAHSSDALQTSPTTPQQLFAITPNDEGAVWSEVAISIPCRGGAKDEYFVRSLAQIVFSTGVAALLQTDRKTYDSGVLFMATNLCADTSVIGELYVSYEIELFDPTSNTGPLSGELYSTSSSLTNFFPATATSAVGTPLLINSGTANQFICLAPGSYVVTIHMVGTVITAGPSLSVIFGGFLFSTPRISINSAGTEVIYVSLLTVSVDTNIAYCQIAISVTATTITTTRVFFGAAVQGMVAG